MFNDQKTKRFYFTTKPQRKKIPKGPSYRYSEKNHPFCHKNEVRFELTKYQKRNRFLKPHRFPKEDNFPAKCVNHKVPHVKYARNRASSKPNCRTSYFLKKKYLPGYSTKSIIPNNINKRREIEMTRQKGGAAYFAKHFLGGQLNGAVEKNILVKIKDDHKRKLD